MKIEDTIMKTIYIPKQRPLTGCLDCESAEVSGYLAEW